MGKARLSIGAAVPLFLLAGCGSGGGDVQSTPTPVPAPAPAPAPAPPPAPPPPAPPPSPSASYDTAEYRRSNGAVQAQALAAYNKGITGAGVLVGVIDSGVNGASPEFAGKISPLSADYAGSRGGAGDEGGHGTAVSAVLLGVKNDSQIHGVAFDATLLSLRTDTPGSCAKPKTDTDEGGCSHNDNAIAAALDGATAARARVVNISLGGSPANLRLRAAIDRATAAGIIIVISAGNDGVKDPAAAVDPDPLAQIANDPVARGLVIIAGAVDATSARAAFSNKAGNSAANYLAALGKSVRSIDNTDTPFLYDGTSFSAPIIAGAVALLAQAYPNLSAAQIVAILYRSANDLGTAGIDAEFGRGELNLAAAFQPLGSTALAGSAQPVSLTDNATLSGAMGDAASGTASGTGALSAAIRDEYGRDFTVGLAPTIHHGVTPSLLAHGLATGTRNLGFGGARTSLAVSIDAGADRMVASPLMLRERDGEAARVLAGAAVTAIGRSTTLGLGFARGADGLVPAADDAATPAFLIGDRSLDRLPTGAFALRRRVGSGIGMTVAAESGDLRLWQTGATGPLSDGWRRYGYGQVAVGFDGRRGALGAGVQVTRMTEGATVLGGRFGPALGGGGAVDWFADARASLTLGAWRLDGSMRRGWTTLGGNGVREGSTLTTQALSATLARAGLFAEGDRFALRYAEPLRVTGGGLLLDLDDGPAQRLSLSPRGHERDWEAAYLLPVGPGIVDLNTYWRRQPAHFADAPDDLGAAIRYTLGF